LPPLLPRQLDQERAERAAALQVMLGGGVEGDGNGSVADKVIKVPSKRGPDVLRYILADYDQHALEGEYFNQYYRRLGKDHFYQLLNAGSVRPAGGDDLLTGA